MSVLRRKGSIVFTKSVNGLNRKAFPAIIWYSPLPMEGKVEEKVVDVREEVVEARVLQALLL